MADSQFTPDIIKNNVVNIAVTIYQRDGNIHNIIFDDIWSELNG
ncbi:hypothetical protein PS003_24255 [Shigella sonnei]|nr:hypothetical protein [Shigella sonnei]